MAPFLLWLLSVAIGLFVLFVVIRAGVREGIRAALRDDLLRYEGRQRYEPGGGRIHDGRDKPLNL